MQGDISMFRTAKTMLHSLLCEEPDLSWESIEGKFASEHCTIVPNAYIGARSMLANPFPPPSTPLLQSRFKPVY
jgi:hypothetical protein